MIIKFSIENWMSFSDPVSFSMIASREKQHGERIPKVAKYQTRLLPISAIYGGNASGKTNFFMALNFVRSMVLEGTNPDKPIPVEPYLLDNSFSDKPSQFKLELLIDDTAYEFSFSVTRKDVLEEKLVKITSSSEKVLYARESDIIEPDSSLDNYEFLKFVSRGTRSNQLFLTNSVSQNVDNFRHVYEWFRDTLVLVAPDSRFEFFEHFPDENSLLYTEMNDMLAQLDTGVSHLDEVEIPFENVPLPEELKRKVQENVSEGMSVRLSIIPMNQAFAFVRKADKGLVARKLVAVHSKSDGTHAKFDIHQESDGTQRVIDLLPAFLEVSASGANKVYIIDELDRSLHSLMTRQLIESYLTKCGPDSRSQLLFTTHDLLLMDQSLFRRDEMWATERNHEGKSEIFPFSDYKDVRYDKDIRKSYLQGRLGGVPKVSLDNSPKSSL